jgi:poly(3-hydroxybutyrate) depolymerase
MFKSSALLASFASVVTGAPVAPATKVAPGTCPSLYGPGDHTVELRIVDPGTGFAWLRSFELFVPDSMPLSEERPTLVNWHGCGSDPGRFESESLINDRVGRYNYYSIYPRGSSRAVSPVDDQTLCQFGDFTCGWNSNANPGGCQTPTGPAPDDVNFANVVLDWMSDNLCVDMDRVFITGFSNGGQMAYRLNCELSQRLAGVATNGMGASAAQTPGGGTCSPQRAIPAVNYCGSTDFVNCYGDASASTLLAQVTAFAAFNGCTGEPTRSELSSTSFCFDATGCPGSLPVRGCGIVGLGHCWPNFPGAGNAECQNQDPANVDASLNLLDFFDSLPAGSTWDKEGSN